MNRIHVCLEIPDLFLVLNMISHSFAALTRKISRSTSTLKINLVFPRTHILFSIHWIYIELLNIIKWVYNIFGTLFSVRVKLSSLEIVY